VVAVTALDPRQHLSTRTKQTTQRNTINPNPNKTTTINNNKGRYFAPLGSILPVGDITESVPKEDADVAILEEPEHVRADD
jgi:hypothetical protein